MNIVMFDAAYPPPVIGGKEKQAHLLAKELVRQGETVHALSYIHSDTKSGEYEGIVVKRVPRGIWAIPIFIIHLFRLRFNYTILHIHTPSRIGQIVALIGFFLNYKILFKFPGQTIFDNLSGIEHFLLKAVLKISSLLVVLEKDTKNKIIDHGIEDVKIFNAVNGVEKNELKTISIETNELKLLFIGRLVPIKCCDDLLKACSLLDTGKINWKLYIVGSGPLESSLALMSADLKISDRVFFMGYQTNTLAFMKNADLLILSSSSEGMSNVLLEAISIGLPIVATDVGATGYILGEYGKQFLCKPNDPHGIASKIEFFTESFDLRKNYGKYLFERGKELFSMERVAKDYINKYHFISKP